MEQGTKEWLEMRKRHIGASDAPVIMNGIHFEKTPYMLWQEKLGVGEEDKDNFAKRRGREMEAEAREQYQLYTGNFVEPSIIFHPTNKFMMASLDGLMVRKGIPLIAVEIKCPGEPDHQTAREGKVPKKYVAQLQHQLACLGTDLLHYFSYRDGKGIVIEVKRDDKYIEKLYAKEQDFWNKVLTFEMPELVNEDFRKRGEEWIEKARIAEDLKRQLSGLKKLSDDATREVVEMSENQNSCGGGFFLRKSVRPGAVNYKNIPELKGIDLETFRKDPVEMWRLIQKKG